MAEALSGTLLISSQELARWALITLTIRCHALTNGGTANKKNIRIVIITITITNMLAQI